MQHAMPYVLGAGRFDSRRFFPGQTLTWLRTVKQYELECFVGDGGVTYINDEAHPLHAGDLLLAVPGDRRRSRLHFEAEYVHFFCDGEEWPALLGRLPRFIPAAGDAAASLTALSRIGRDFAAFDGPGELSAAAQLSALLCDLWRAHGRAEGEGAQGEAEGAIMKAIEFMREHYAQPIHAEDMARHCSLSVSYFYHLFAKATNMTPGDYLRRLRLTQAKALLTASELPLSRIAEECGFANQSYFSYSFRMQFGLSPSAFRERGGAAGEMPGCLPGKNPL